MTRRLLPPILAIATATAALLAMPALADAQTTCPLGTTPDANGVCQSVVYEIVDRPTGRNLEPVGTAPADQPAPHRSLLDRLLGRNKAPATPAPAAPAAPAPSAIQQAPPPPAQYNPPPTTAPAQSQEPPVVPLVILPPPGTPLPSPSERTVWLHTCVDLYVANTHLLQIDNQQLDVPPLAYVIFRCAANPAITPLIPITPGPVVPGQPPSAGSQIVYTRLPVTG